MTRRDLIKAAVGTAGAALAAPMVNRGRYVVFAGSPIQYSARSIDLVGRTTTIDMMGMFSVKPGDGMGALFRDSVWLSDPDRFTLEDLQQFKDAGISIFSGGPGVVPYDNVLRYFASWNGFLAHHSDHLMRISSATNLNRVKESGKIGVLLGVQNSEHFRTVNDIDFFHSLGQRVSQLTYNGRNRIGYGCTESRDEGLSDYGVAVVERMNTRGMAIDVSHSGDRTTLDAIAASTKPVLITHSNCRALNPGHPRCKTDETIRKMASSGGVLGITMIPFFVKDQDPISIDDVLNHFDHVAKLVGVEHLGVGSDVVLEGIEPTAEELLRLQAESKLSGLNRVGPFGLRDKMYIEGLNHPRRIFDLTDGFIRRKYSDKDIEAILGGNFKRALTQIWPSSSR